jgi:very-short-patch-repair endonuclease
MRGRAVSEDWLQGRAKDMRREPAFYERQLWKLLRDRRLEGLKFRRQVVLGRYVADFVCFRHRLIVEADGPLHDERIGHDEARDAWLTAEGFVVLRFTNQQIESRSWEVIGAIMAASERRLTTG